MSSEELRLFDKVRVFLDEDFSSAEHFTVRDKLYCFKLIKNLIYSRLFSGSGKFIFRT